MTERVIRALDVAGLPVVSIDGGDDIAEIKDVVFDGTEHRLVGFTLNKRGWFRGTLRLDLPAQSVVAIGPDAVMVRSSQDLQQPADSPAALSGDVQTHEVAGSRVLSADGTDLGVVSGVVLSTGDDPAAVGYEVTGDNDDTYFVPISAQMALSDTNLLIPAEATAFIHNDLAGFGAAIHHYRATLDNSSGGPAL
jgi:uncharacterized protein YrrD